MVERRKIDRKKVRNAFIEYRKSSILSFLKKEKGKKFPMLNVSSAGLQFLSLEHVKIKEKFDLTMNAPDFIEPIEVKGVVAWTKKVKGKNAYRVGIKFTKIGKFEKEQIMRLVDQTGLRWSDGSDYK